MVGGKLAKRFRCTYYDTPGRHAKGNGSPRSPKCSYCGSRLTVETGLHGVFVWTGKGRYPARDAVKTYTSYPAADRYCDAHEAENYVVRWIYAEDVNQITDGR